MAALVAMMGVACLRAGRELDGLREPASRPRVRGPELRPEWTRKSRKNGPFCTPQANSSHLASRETELLDNHEPGLLQELLTVESTSHGRLQSELRDEWDSMTRQQDLRQRHQLFGMSEQQERSDQSRRIGQLFLRSLMVNRVRESVQKGGRKSEAIRVAVKTNEHIEAFSAKGLSVEPAPGLEFGSRADLIRQRGAVWMNSPLLDGRLDMDFGTPAAANGASGDRLRVSVVRPLPWDFSSGLVYGLNSRMTTTSLSQRMTPNLVWTIENHQRIFESTSEQVARFNYQFRF